MLHYTFFPTIDYFSTGELPLEDSEDEVVMVMNLPQLPLPTRDETISVVLMQPMDYPTELGHDATCIVHIRNDIGM